MTNNPIPVAVVGAGNMGANHVRVYDDIPGANLVEVVEPDDETASDIRENYQVDVFDEVSELSRAQAASIAVPNELHQPVAIDTIESGLDVLIEKPLALSVPEAEEILETATTNDAILQVGHIERFNPVIQTLSKILENQDVIAIEGHRLGPFNEHLSNENVVFDLMIHDLDVIDSLIDSDLNFISSVGATPRSDEIDHAVAQLKFKNGTLGTVVGSHVTHGKVRKLAVTTRDAYIRVNYQEQTLEIQRRGTEYTATLNDLDGYRMKTTTETPYIQTREPLKNEIEHFLDCVRSREVPLVSGEEGLEAVATAEQVLRKINHQSI